MNYNVTPPLAPLGLCRSVSRKQLKQTLPVSDRIIWRMENEGCLPRHSGRPMPYRPSMSPVLKGQLMIRDELNCLWEECEAVARKAAAAGVLHVKDYPGAGPIFAAFEAAIVLAESHDSEVRS